ncbi:hypothetical protein ACFOWM_06235 [Ferruginibacter yonginensis]|uniref:Phage prohead protease, HK97 family n=1 Tax=Ferruginibacter yonginensis TaxID=1310416 RepID=A0ABV8QS43_9BACT
MKKPKPFVLNDETVENCYGFSIPNNGIDLNQFSDNPVMLNSHQNDVEHVIGKWNDINVSGNQLLATPEFDVEDDAAKSIAGKVERGFVRACSMGFGFLMEDLKYIGGKVVLTKCVLKEASIVAVPGNAKALRLYDLATGNLVTEDELQIQLNGLKEKEQNNFQTQIEKMKQILLSAPALVALGLTAQPNTSEELDASITALKGKLEAAQANALTEKQNLEQKLTAAKTELANYKTEQMKVLLDAAEAEGKITNAERADYENLELATATKFLAKLEAKQTLADKVVGGGKTSFTEPKTFEELMKLTDAQKDEFKTANPTKYNALLA